MPTQEQSESLAPVEAAAGAIRSADELKEGDRVVYPKQGVCRVMGRQSKDIAGQRLEFVTMAREEDNATILVPLPKVATIGLRKVADAGEIVDVFELLASSFEDPELDWKVRHRMHGDLLAAGGILGVAEVLKALQALANLRPLPQKERERYDEARHLLVDEVAVALGVPHATAEDYIDLALIPPPGVVRPASKPRKLAALPPRPARPAPRRRALDEEEGIGFDEEELELGVEEEAPPEEEAAEAEAEAPEAGEEEEAKPERAAKKPAPAKKPAAAAKPAEKKPAEKKPAARKAPAKTAAKSAKKAKPEGEEEAKGKPAAKKAAPAKAPAKPAKAKAAAKPKAEPKPKPKAAAKPAEAKAKKPAARAKKKGE